MQAFKISFFEEATLPANPKPFRIYFVKEGAYANAYVTGHNAVPVPMGNIEMTAALINLLVDTTPGAGKTTRQILKQQILLDR